MAKVNENSVDVNQGQCYTQEEIEKIYGMMQYCLGLVSRCRREITNHEDTVREINLAMVEMRRAIRDFRKPPQRQQVL